MIRCPVCQEEVSTNAASWALEPYLRRRWPERIISWNRLLAGEFRDPLVGRDILIGSLLHED
jgi:hypothetical protein